MVSLWLAQAADGHNVRQTCAGQDLNLRLRQEDELALAARHRAAADTARASAAPAAAAKRLPEEGPQPPGGCPQPAKRSRAQDLEGASHSTSRWARFQSVTAAGAAHSGGAALGDASLRVCTQDELGSGGRSRGAAGGPTSACFAKGTAVAIGSASSNAARAAKGWGRLHADAGSSDVCGDVTNPAGGSVADNAAGSRHKDAHAGSGDMCLGSTSSSEGASQWGHSQASARGGITDTTGSSSGVAIDGTANWGRGATVNGSALVASERGAPRPQAAGWGCFQGCAGNDAARGDGATSARSAALDGQAAGKMATTPPSGPSPRASKLFLLKDSCPAPLAGKSFLISLAQPRQDNQSMRALG